MKTITRTISILCALVIISCETEPKRNQVESCFEIDQSDTVSHTLEGNWILLGFKNNTLGEEECTPDILREMTVSFDYNNHIKATSSCNSFEGYYEKFDNDSLNIDSLSTTLIACANDTVMMWEENYFMRLKKAKTFLANGDILTINTSAEYSLVFRFDTTIVAIEYD